MALRALLCIRRGAVPMNRDDPTVRPFPRREGVGVRSSTAPQELRNVWLQRGEHRRQILLKTVWAGMCVPYVLCPARIMGKDQFIKGGEGEIRS